MLQNATTPLRADAVESQAEAVAQTALTWLRAPLGAGASSARAFVRNRADEVLPLLDADGAAAVLAVLVANYNGWDEDVRTAPLVVQAKVLAHLLQLEWKLWLSSPVGKRLAQPLGDKARELTRNADALRRKAQRELAAADAEALLRKAQALETAASRNEKRGIKALAAEQRKQAEAFRRLAQATLGQGDHPAVVEAQQLQEKACKLRAEAAALRALPEEMAENIREAIAEAIAPEAATLLDTRSLKRAVRLAASLSVEWRIFAVSRLRYASAGAAVVGALAELAKDEVDPKLVLQQQEDELFYRRVLGDPSLSATADEAVARLLFPTALRGSITVEHVLVRLVEELRRAVDAPAVDAQLLEKIEQLSAYAEATGDRAAASKLIELQHKAALNELKAERRAVKAFERRKAHRALTVRLARAIRQSA